MAACIYHGKLKKRSHESKKISFLKKDGLFKIGTFHCEVNFLENGWDNEND